MIQKNLETALALIGILLIVFLLTKEIFLIFATLILVIITLLAPKTISPLAKVYFGFVKILGTINSKILLSIVFFGFLTPLAVLKRAFQGNYLQIKKPVKQSSLWKEKNIKFTKEMLKKPY